MTICDRCWSVGGSGPIGEGSGAIGASGEGRGGVFEAVFQVSAGNGVVHPDRNPSSNAVFADPGAIVDHVKVHST